MYMGLWIDDLTLTPLSAHMHQCGPVVGFRWLRNLKCLLFKSILITATVLECNSLSFPLVQIYLPSSRTSAGLVFDMICCLECFLFVRMVEIFLFFRSFSQIYHFKYFCSLLRTNCTCMHRNNFRMINARSSQTKCFLFFCSCHNSTISPLSAWETLESKLCPGSICQTCCNSTSPETRSPDSRVSSIWLRTRRVYRSSTSWRIRLWHNSSLEAHSITSQFFSRYVHCRHIFGLKTCVVLLTVCYTSLSRFCSFSMFFSTWEHMKIYMFLSEMETWDCWGFVCTTNWSWNSKLARLLLYTKHMILV